jgi:hypothetical protein
MVSHVGVPALVFPSSLLTLYHSSLVAGQCITVFSAPNYCDQMGNKGAFIRFTDEHMQPDFNKFEAVGHPNVPPMAYAGNMNNFI